MLINILDNVMAMQYQCMFYGLITIRHADIKSVNPIYCAEVYYLNKRGNTIIKPENLRSGYSFAKGVSVVSGHSAWNENYLSISVLHEWGVQQKPLHSDFFLDSMDIFTPVSVKFFSWSSGKGQEISSRFFFGCPMNSGCAMDLTYKSYKKLFKSGDECINRDHDLMRTLNFLKNDELMKFYTDKINKKNYLGDLRLNRIDIQDEKTFINMIKICELSKKGTAEAKPYGQLESFGDTRYVSLVAQSSVCEDDLPIFSNIDDISSAKFINPVDLKIWSSGDWVDIIHDNEGRVTNGNTDKIPKQLIL